MSSSINIFKVGQRHFGTFATRSSNGKTRWRKLDLTVHIILPLAVAVTTVFLPNQKWPMSDLIAGLGVLSAAMFGLVVLVFQLQDGRSSFVGSVQRSHKVRDLIERLFHNSMYATVLSVTACCAVVLFSVIGAGAFGKALVALLITHLILTFLMCAKALSQAFVTLRREQDRLEKSSLSNFP